MALTGNGGGRYITPLPVPEEQVLRGKTDKQPDLQAFPGMHSVIVWIAFSTVSMVTPHPSQGRKKMPAVLLIGIPLILEKLKSSEEQVQQFTVGQINITSNRNGMLSADLTFLWKNKAFFLRNGHD